MAVLHVSPVGSDTNDGTSHAAPFRSLARAQQEVMARATERANQSIRVLLAAGRFELSETLELQPGPTGSHVTFAAAERGAARLSGGRLVDGWERVDGASVPLWRAPLPAATTGHQLWVGASRATVARHPNSGYLRWRAALPPPFEKWGIIYEPGALESWGDQLVVSPPAARSRRSALPPATRLAF